MGKCCERGRCEDAAEGCFLPSEGVDDDGEDEPVDEFAVGEEIER